MTPRSDFELLDAWCAGDRRSGEDLFERHFDRIFRFFRGKVQEPDLEDLVQRTFLASLEARAGFRREASFGAWLLGIARRQLWHYWRDRRDEEPDFSVSSVSDLGPTPSGVVAAREEQRLLSSALINLPLDLQIALELHYWEGMSGPELAVVLDIPEGTVRSRLRRARERLEEEMGRLAASPMLLTRTVDDLDRWALSLRELMGPSSRAV